MDIIKNKTSYENIVEYSRKDPKIKEEKLFDVFTPLNIVEDNMKEELVRRYNEENHGFKLKLDEYVFVLLDSNTKIKVS